MITEVLKEIAVEADSLGREAMRVLEELRELVLDIDGCPGVELEDIPEKWEAALQTVESLHEAILRWRTRLESAPTPVPALQGE
jgi:hypothetical protein